MCNITVYIYLYITEFENTMLELSVLTNQVKDGDYAGQFEWVDSILVRALKYGHWLFISNANLCRYVYVYVQYAPKKTSCHSPFHA